MINAYPLQWPYGWPRTTSHQRKRASFTHMGKPLTVSVGANRVLDELGAMLIDRQDIVISTNVRLRLDGLPRSGDAAPSDCGAAVYWETRKHQRRVMAIDRYETVADNLAAIAATLEAMRKIERHGGAQILDRAFTGFTALAAPAAKRDWQVVLELQDLLQPKMEDIRLAYRRLANVRHPDKGGSNDAMAELNGSLADAEKWVRGS